jgi:hypothetical protein
MAKQQPSEAEVVKALGDDARQAWRHHAEHMQAIIRELSAANLSHPDPELTAKLEACERALAGFIAVVEDWPEEVTVSSMLQQRAKLSLANAAVLEAMNALPLDTPNWRRDKLRLQFDS